MKDTSDLLQTNFGKGGMKALVKDYLITHRIATIEGASYGTRVDNDGKQNFVGNVQLSGLWSFAISTM